MQAFVYALLISVQAVLLCAAPGLADSLRIHRPAQGISPAEFYEAHNALEDFNRWRHEYGLPTMCPMVLCHGNCAHRDDRCTFTVCDGATSCLRSASVEETLCNRHGGGMTNCCKQVVVDP